MGDWTILHNPKCSKSRQCLKILEDSGAKFEVREYLKSPLNQNELKSLLELLKGPASQLVRVKENEFKAEPFNLESSDEIVSKLMEIPKLMERPIVFNKTKAAIGRPPENIEMLLKAK